MIDYKKGDATQPEGDGVKLIIHCCNDIGAWGKGFVLAINKRWIKPMNEYMDWAYHREGTGTPFELGQVQYVPVKDDIVVCNMIGQRDIYRSGGQPPIRYDAIRKCLQNIRSKIKDMAKKATEKNFSDTYRKYSVHCPMFGAGLAGGNWKEIERIIQEELTDQDVSVTVYSLR